MFVIDAFALGFGLVASLASIGWAIGSVIRAVNKF